MDHRELVELAAEIDADLAARIDFILEVDKLKHVIRRSLLVDGSRQENTAEHSWHLALAVLVLAPQAGPDVDVARAMEMLLIHDLVEIDAGDAYIYDEEARLAAKALEDAAAERIFGLLPADEAARLGGLWEEYEQRSTPTARFAYAIDRLQPLLLNAASGGVSWTENGIRHSQVLAVNAPIADGSAAAWAVATRILDLAADRGALADDRHAPT